MTPLRTIAATALALCIARGAGADTFKCGADALNAAVEPKSAATATATAPAPAETAATNTAAAAQAPQDSELERLLAAVKADEFPNDKARDVTLAKAKAILVDAEYRLPADVASPAKVLEDLVDAASMPEVAYSVLLQRDNAALFAARDQQGVRDWLYGTVAGIQPGFRGEWDNFELSPVPDKRISFVEATKDTAKGTIRSAWKFEGGKCNWSFTIPEGAKATVCVNGLCSRYVAGEYQLEIKQAQP